MQARLFKAVLFGSVFLAANAQAHTVWLEPIDATAGEYRVLFGGHAGQLQPYDTNKLKVVEAFDAKGGAVKIDRSTDAEGVRLNVRGTPALIAMHFDNGIHTRTQRGPSVEKPMNEVPGALRATYAVKYHKTIVEWQPLVSRPLGQPFEVVPLDASVPRAGHPLRVKVLRDGEPVAGVKLGRGEEGSASDPVTDADGVASFVPQRGFNKLWAGKRFPIADNPAYTELSFEYLLGFDAE